MARGGYRPGAGRKPKLKAPPVRGGREARKEYHRLWYAANREHMRERRVATAAIAKELFELGIITRDQFPELSLAQIGALGRRALRKQLMMGSGADQRKGEDE